MKIWLLFLLWLGWAVDVQQGQMRVVQNVQSAESWSSYLKERYIVRYFTRTGYTEKNQLWLCSDESFQRSGSGGGFGGGVSGAYQNSGNGAWSAQGSLSGAGELLLHYASGETATIELSMVDDKLHVNGRQWLRGTNDRCE